MWAKLRLPSVLSEVVIRVAEHWAETLLMTPVSPPPPVRLPMNGQLMGSALPKRTWFTEAVNSMSLLRKCLLPMMLGSFGLGLMMATLWGL